jgi:hypothetical protein
MFAGKPTPLAGIGGIPWSSLRICLLDGILVTLVGPPMIAPNRLYSPGMLHKVIMPHG